MENAIYNLIGNWELINKTFSPFKQYFEDVKHQNYHGNLAEFCLISGRQEFWEVYICLIFYCQERTLKPTQVLRSIQFEKIIENGFEIENLNGSDREFFKYSFQHSTVPQSEFIAGAYVLSLVYSQIPILNDEIDINCILDCQKYWKEDDYSSFIECVKEEHC